MEPISAIATRIVAPNAALQAPKSPEGAFQNLLASTIQNVENSHSESARSVQQFLAGESDDLHKVALSTQRAELTSELFMQVRNKVVSAYQEVMRMQM